MYEEGWRPCCDARSLAHAAYNIRLLHSFSCASPRARFLSQPDVIVGRFAILRVHYLFSIKILQILFLSFVFLPFYCFDFCKTGLLVTAECRIRPKRQLRNGGMKSTTPKKRNQKLRHRRRVGRRKNVPSMRPLFVLYAPSRGIEVMLGQQKNYFVFASTKHLLAKAHSVTCTASGPPPKMQTCAQTNRR